jgi:transposase
VLKGYDEVAVFLGLDVGKQGHHAVAQDRSGKKLLDRALPNDEAKLRELYGRMKVHGPVLLVVDQPATIGALPVAVALDEGITVAYLPGLAMRRIADLHPGSAKTDARDAHVIANAARTMPHTLRALKVDDETIAELTVLSGFDDDLAQQITATSNRIRGLLTQIHPALERVLGPRLEHPAVLDLLETWPTPAALTAAGKTRVRTRLLKKAPRLGGRLTEEIFAALAAQTVVVTGTNAAGIVLPRLAAQLAALRQQRAEVAEKVEELVAAHPLSKVLTTMPGVGVRTCARILTEVVGKDFPTAGHLASYAGLAPVTRRSGTSIRGEHAPRGGNKVLKRALFLSAFAALSDPVSRAYYDRKRAQQKKHNAALIALARRRTDVLYAMLRDNKPYAEPPAAAA